MKNMYKTNFSMIIIIILLKKKYQRKKKKINLEICFIFAKTMITFFFDLKTAANDKFLGKAT